ncbi:MAG: hypothetical protein GX175_02350 [Halanaerobiaceae bacterium]|nr:hypothetical protein [Halanaerobiaceae bacterium]
MENFIKSGKEVSIILDEGIEEIMFTALANNRVTRLDDNNYSELEEGLPYTLKQGVASREYYRIQVFASGSRNRAEEIYHDLYQKGYQDISIVEEDGLYKIRLGIYKDKESSREVVEGLKELGWNPWLVKVSEEGQSREKIYLYNQDNEVVFSGQKLFYQGSFLMADGNYSGITSFEIDNRGLTIINRTKIDNIIGGIIDSILSDLNPDLEEAETDEIIKAYAVLLRTNIFYEILSTDNRPLINSLYKGMTTDKRILHNSRMTDGQILGRRDEKRGEILTELSMPGINEYLKKALPGSDYKNILAGLFPESRLIDLNIQGFTYTAVDAEVKWGLRYKEMRYINWQGPVVYTVLDLDLNRRNLYFRPVLAQGRVPGLDSLESIIKEHGALAGINGGYFDYSRPLGLIYIDNTLVSEPVKDRTALLLTDENEVFFERVYWEGYLETLRNKIYIDGVNRKPGNNQTVLFNKYYGERAPLLKSGMLELLVVDDIVQELNFYSEEKEQGTIIPENGYVIQAHGSACQELVFINPGLFILQKDVFTPDFNKKNVIMAISAGPRLVKDGDIYINSSDEEFQADIAVGRAPRSAVGITQDKRLVFFTVDGRQPGYSIGITLEQLAQIMKDYGILDGMNLDGGNSASMVVRGFTMNNPSGERLLNNAIIIGSE